MIVVDIEATWLDTENCSILSIWAVNLLNSNDTFYWECRCFEWAKVFQEWLDVNWFTLDDINDVNKQSEWDLVLSFINWLNWFPVRVIAWQHPMALDVPILKSACKRVGIDFNFSYKTVDLHSIWFSHIMKNWFNLNLKNDWTSDISLDTIAKYVWLTEEPRPHNALTWAKFEAECFNRLIFWKKLFDEFAEFPLKFSL